MNKIIFHILLAFTTISCTMEQPPSKDSKPSKVISKKDLIALVKDKDARGVLFAISHQNAAQVIDSNVIQIAQEQKTDQLTLSRTGSIFLMLTRHAPKPEPTQQPPSPTTTEKSPHSARQHHHSTKKHRERSPTEQLNRMIKKKNFEGIKEFAASSGAHFIDEKAVAYAQEKYDLVSKKNPIEALDTPEHAILVLLKKYAPSKKERRKSCMVKKDSHKGSKP